MISIDESTCKTCGICGIVCPRHVPVTEDGRTIVSKERVGLCLDCGHCAAICPTGSVSVDGLDPSAFRDVQEIGVTSGQLLTVLRQRRSVRRYRKRAVPRELVERVVEAVHASPTGTGRACTSLVVLSDRARMQEMMGIVHEQYAKLERALGNPIARLMIKRRAGKRSLVTLRDFVMPGMHWSLRWYREGKGDEISRDCPVMLIFHGPALEPQMNDNCTVAAFHAILMAETLGLGTCFNHLIPPMVNRSDAIRQMLGIARQNDAFTAVTMGFPRYSWKRTVPHRLAEVRYLEGGPGKVA